MNFHSDIIFSICDYLEYRDLFKVRIINKSWKNAAEKTEEFRAIIKLKKWMTPVHLHRGFRYSKLRVVRYLDELNRKMGPYSILAENLEMYPLRDIPKSKEFFGATDDLKSRLINHQMTLECKAVGTISGYYNFSDAFLPIIRGGLNSIGTVILPWDIHPETKIRVGELHMGLIHIIVQNVYDGSMEIAYAPSFKGRVMWIRENLSYLIPISIKPDQRYRTLDIFVRYSSENLLPPYIKDLSELSSNRNI